MANTINLDRFSTIVLVAPDFGQWVRGPSIIEAFSLLKKRCGAKRGTKTTIIAFASDKPVDIETDVMVRVIAAPGAQLVKATLPVTL